MIISETASTSQTQISTPTSKYVGTRFHVGKFHKAGFGGATNCGWIATNGPLLPDSLFLQPIVFLLWSAGLLENEVSYRIEIEHATSAKPVTRCVV
ncbi:hypothetical protein J6590_035653 [Homalodisca vitripennis]|nr:hypothetical protein J6590_035653 [Homalodisca vitripennis]